MLKKKEILIKGYNGIMDLDLTNVNKQFHKNMIEQHKKDINIVPDINKYKILLFLGFNKKTNNTATIKLNNPPLLRVPNTRISIINRINSIGFKICILRRCKHNTPESITNTSPGFI